MGRRDHQNDALAAWANLSLEQRISDRTAAVILAAEQIRIMAELVESPSTLLTSIGAAAARAEYELRPLLSQLPVMPNAVGDRDMEVAKILAELDRRLISGSRGGPTSNTAWASAERVARAYGLAFYFEIRRLEHVWLLRTD